MQCKGGDGGGESAAVLHRVTHRHTGKCHLREGRQRAKEWPQGKRPSRGNYDLGCTGSTAERRPVGKARNGQRRAEQEVDTRYERETGGAGSAGAWARSH